MLNPTIGKMMSIDRFSEKYYGMSPYQFAANNPIAYVDINGDSVSLNKDFSSSKYAMSAYSTFIATNAGKQFLKDFGIGGKFEKVNIIFGLKNMWATGGTKQFAIDKNGSKKEIRNEDDSLGKGVVTSLLSKSTLEFNVKNETETNKVIQQRVNAFDIK